MNWKSQVLKTNSQVHHNSQPRPNKKRFVKKSLEEYEQKMLSYFGLKTYQRGFMYMVENRVFDVDLCLREFGVLTMVELSGKCFGQAPHAYVINVLLNMDHPDQPIHRTSCSCPVSRDCKHAATLCFHYFQNFIKSNKSNDSKNQVNYKVIEHPLKNQLAAEKQHVLDLKKENERLKELLSSSSSSSSKCLAVDRSQNTSQSLLDAFISKSLSPELDSSPPPPSSSSSPHPISISTSKLLQPHASVFTPPRRRRRVRSRRRFQDSSKKSALPLFSSSSLSSQPSKRHRLSF
mmetsp:Transcript_13186/g.19913  ORF Transcript_13186/g.19913 Transcript_13186/m.19913 type:complete len:291 (-) Transcript_13186:42-914(-)